MKTFHWLCFHFCCLTFWGLGIWCWHLAGVGEGRSGVAGSGQRTMVFGSHVRCCPARISTPFSHINFNNTFQKRRSACKLHPHDTLTWPRYMCVSVCVYGVCVCVCVCLRENMYFYVCAQHTKQFPNVATRSAVKNAAAAAASVALPLRSCNWQTSQGGK